MFSQLPLAKRRFCSVSVTSALLDLRSDAISCQGSKEDFVTNMSGYSVAGYEQYIKV